MQNDDCALIQGQNSSEKKVLNCFVCYHYCIRCSEGGTRYAWKEKCNALFLAGGRVSFARLPKACSCPRKHPEIFMHALNRYKNGTMRKNPRNLRFEVCGTALQSWVSHSRLPLSQLEHWSFALADEVSVLFKFATDQTSCPHKRAQPATDETFHHCGKVQLMHTILRSLHHWMAE